jgi:hypothetical protein
MAASELTTAIFAEGDRGPGAFSEHSLCAVDHFQSSDLPENRHANDRFQSTAAIGGRPLEGTNSPKQSLTVLRRWSTSDAGRTSAVRSAELVLPTQSRCMPIEVALPTAVARAQGICVSACGPPPTQCGGCDDESAGYRKHVGFARVAVRVMRVRRACCRFNGRPWGRDPEAGKRRPQTPGPSSR